MPVVCCSLHSPAGTRVRGLGGGRVAYVQLEGGALAGRAFGHGARTQGSAAAGDGDRGGLVLRRRRRRRSACPRLSPGRPREGFAAVVCAVGPGIVGTGTALGHGGVATAEAANVARATWRHPMLAVRVSVGDPRERHQGVSHHTRGGASTLSRRARRSRGPAGWPLRAADRRACDRRWTYPIGGRRATGLPLESHGARARRRSVVLCRRVRSRAARARQLGFDGGAADSARSSGSGRGTRSAETSRWPARSSAPRSTQGAASSIRRRCTARRKR